MTRSSDLFRGIRRLGAFIAGAVTLWAIQDIAVWRTFFEGHPWGPTADLYQFWHQAFLVLLIVVGGCWLRGWRFVVFAVATWTLANSGLADILYYWLDLRAVPDTLPWLDAIHPLLLHPATAASVVESAAIWIAVWAVGLTTLRTVVVLRQKSRSGV